MLPAFMRTMTVAGPAGRLLPAHKPVPQALGHEVVVRVLACGICRTDMHIIDGELPPHRPAVVPGHEVVGQVAGRTQDRAKLSLALGQQLSEAGRKAAVVGVHWKTSLR